MPVIGSGGGAKKPERNRVAMIAVSQRIGPLWGIGGIAAVLIYAIVKLSRYVLEAVATDLPAWAWVLLLANVAFLLYAEGWRGFQRQFSPRVAARALHLQTHPTALRVWLAPLFCAGYFGGTRALVVRIWLGTALIVAAVLLVQELTQPWRGILDAGVCAGLTWGTVSLLAASWRALATGVAPVPPETPAVDPPLPGPGPAA
jgi:hypothetical protein